MLAPETKQASFVALCKACAFLVNRYPYVCAITLMLSTSEKAKIVKSHPPQLHNVYAHLGMYFLAGTAMSFDILKTGRFFAVVTAAQFGFLSYQEYAAGQYKDTILARILMRNIALVGCYLMVGGGLTDFQRNIQKNHRLILFGKQLLGAYAFMNSVLIWNSFLEFRAHSVHLPGGWITTYGIFVVYIVCGILIYANYESEYFSKLLAWILVVDTVFIDMDARFWWNGAQVTYWTQMIIASKNICVAACLILIRKGL